MSTTTPPKGKSVSTAIMDQVIKDADRQTTTPDDGRFAGMIRFVNPITFPNYQESCVNARKDQTGGGYTMQFSAILRAFYIRRWDADQQLAWEHIVPVEQCVQWQWA